MPTNKNGLVLWEGPSKLNGDPIVVIATGFDHKSSNGKTGDMLQTWILHQDVHPVEAFKSGDGMAVCANCPHHGTRQASCYVQWGYAPTSIWHAYKRGSYAKAKSVAPFAGRAVRFGAAGDPAMAPVSLWERIAEVASVHTAYTHQWRQPWAQRLKGMAQASCDGLTDYLDATAHGWKCFLVSRERPEGLVQCQASDEAGHKTTCFECHLCDGASANVVINPHGKGAKRIG